MTDPAVLREALRAAEGITRIAQLSGVARSTIYNFLAGTMTPRPSTLARIADGLSLARSEGTAPRARPLSPAGRIAAEAAYAATLGSTSPRERAKEVAEALLERVSATRDLPYLKNEVALRLGVNREGRPAELSLPQRLALARVHLEAGEYDRTLSLVEDVPAGARAHWQVARWLASEALRMQGRLREARRAAEDAVRSRDPIVRAWAHWNLAKVHGKRAEAPRAIRHFRSAIHAGTHGKMSEYEAADIQAWSLWGLAYLEVRSGGPDAAIRTFRRASEIAPYGDGGVQVWIAHGLAHVLTLTGELEQARDLYTAALDLTDTMGNEPYKSWMYVGLASIAMTQGAYAPAIDLLARADGVYQQTLGAGAPGHTYALAVASLARALLGQLSWPEAHAKIASLSSATRETGYVVSSCELSLIEGESARHAGHITRAIEIFDSAHREAARRHFSILEAHALLALATAQLELTPQSAHRIAGRRSLSRALRIYERWQSRWGIARCLMLAHAYGASADQRRMREMTTPSYPLERAEIDVLRRGSPPITPLTFPGD